MTFGLFLPRRWTRQPQGPVEIDWANPITRGLVALVIPSAGRRELVSRKALLYGTLGVTHTQDGVALCSDKMVLHTDCFYVPVPRKQYSALSQFLKTRTTALSGYPGWIGGGSISDTSALRTIGLGSSSAGNTWGSLSPSWSIHGPTWGSGANVFECVYTEYDTKYFADGVSSRCIGQTWSKDKNSGFGRVFMECGEIPRTGGTAQTTVSDWSQSSSSGFQRLGNAGTTYGATHQISAWALWERDLEPVEWKTLFEAPFQLARPITRRTFFLPTTNTLFDKLNEAIPDDDTYVSTSDLSTFEVALNAVDDPMIHTDHILKVRAKKTGTGKGVRVRLLQGSTVIDTWELK